MSQQVSASYTFWVTALQSSNTRKIDLYSKHWENKSEALTKTAEHLNTKLYRLKICIIVFASNIEMDYLVTYSFYHLSSSQTKPKSIKKNRFRMTNSMSRELINITHDLIGTVQSDKGFPTPF